MQSKLMVICFLFSALAGLADEPDTARANRLSLVTLNSENDCRALLNPTIASQCLQSVQARKSFPITTEEYHQVMGGGKKAFPQNDPSSPLYNPTFNMGSRGTTTEGAASDEFLIDEQTTETDSSGQISKTTTKNRSAYAIREELSSIKVALWISATIAAVWSAVAIVSLLNR